MYRPWKSSRPKKVFGLGWMIHGSQGFRTTGYAKFGWPGLPGLSFDKGSRRKARHCLKSILYRWWILLVKKLITRICMVVSFRCFLSILCQDCRFCPLYIFGNNPPQMVPIAGSKYCSPGFGGFDSGPNLQLCLEKCSQIWGLRSDVSQIELVGETTWPPQHHMKDLSRINHHILRWCLGGPITSATHRHSI